MTAIAPHVSAFLLEHLPHVRGASVHTVKSYAHAIKLFVVFAGERLERQPALIDIGQLDAQLVLDWLDCLENDRANSASSRNVRLAAIKSMFRFLELRMPESLGLSRQIHAIPAKRCENKLVDWLERDELQALLDAPSLSTRGGLRDRAMMHLTYACGLRVSELTSLTLASLNWPGPQSVRIRGKGRRERVMPLWHATQEILGLWIDRRPPLKHDGLFPNARGGIMNRHGFASRLAVHVEAASRACPSLARKNVTPHVLRHSCAIHVLQATGDIRKVSIWLGHASVTSTETYLRALPDEKLSILNSHPAPNLEKGQFGDVEDSLISLLDSLRTG